LQIEEMEVDIDLVQCDLVRLAFPLSSDSSDGAAASAALADLRANTQTGDATESTAQVLCETLRTIA
jgi:hypothetical protein